MKTLILFRGLPGAGKTTAAQLLVKHNCAADDWMIDEDGNYCFDQNKLIDCHQSCIHQVKQWLELGIELIGVHNTFTQEWEMLRFMDLAEKYGYRVIRLIVENHHGSENLHGCPGDNLVKMKNRFSVKL
jgi:predicted kinase